MNTRFHTYRHALMVNTNTNHNSSQTGGETSQSTSGYHQSVDNNAHPLYLHNNDQPGMILISKKLLDLKILLLGNDLCKSPYLLKIS